MSPVELLNINGNFKESPLVSAVRKLHKAFSGKHIPYAVIGGMADTGLPMILIF
jgi:hypothetical protein